MYTCFYYFSRELESIFVKEVKIFPKVLANSERIIENKEILQKAGISM